MDVPALNDESQQHPIPTAWRPIFSGIVAAFADRDYQLRSGVPGVLPVSAQKASHIASYVADYGETLIDLPDETWATSIALWMGTHWQVLVDLWTAGEGRSDLVLDARVYDRPDGPAVDIHLVYVP